MAARWLRTRLDAHFRLRLRAYIRHVWQKVATLTIGAVFVTPFGKRLRAALAGSPRRFPDIRVAIVAHVYYLDLVDEILECRAALPGEPPLFFTVPKDRVEQAEARMAGVPGVSIVPCENRGRDIAPFLTLLGTGLLDPFDAVLKLHTKRSPHLLDGDIRRKLLFQMLCGEPNATARALTAFEKPDTGMVGWDDCWRQAPAYWMRNEARVRGIGARMKAGEALRLGFFEGSMFWFRPKAFDALRELALTPEDFEAEAGQTDGTLHHAVERCFTIAAWTRGSVVRDLKGRLLG
jgi:rhamnosyltransferase